MSEKQNSTDNIPQGLVAQIINAREVAITLGSDHGVKKGMRFAVLAATPLEIRDPQTSEVLDTVDREKVRVEATTVRPKISICQTYRIKRIAGGLMYNLGSSYSNPINEMFRAPQEEVESLKADEHSLPEPLSEQESYVKIGDRVVLLTDDRKN